MRVINRSYTSSRYCTYIDSCDELSRSVRRNSYILRLTSTASDFVGSHLPVDKRGNIMMLTLTYANSFLPYAVNPINGQLVPVFSRTHIKTFLNRLKVRFYRYFKGTYKYFLCMEYGKDTKRQHYHVLFFLSYHVDYKKFVDLVRELWIYGYTFPSPSGDPYKKALLRSYDKGLSYAAKYVCKDVSYYSLPSVIKYHEYVNSLPDDSKSILMDGFPRIYQSNGIGSSLVSQLENDFENVVSNGLYDSIRKCYVPVPYYVYSKFFYKNVPSFDSRVGKNDKILYDRVLRVDSSLLVEYKIASLCRHVSKDISFFNLYFASLPDFKSYSHQYSSSISWLKNNLTSDIYTLSFVFNVYRDYIRVSSDVMLRYVNSFSDLFSVDFVKNFVVSSSDIYSNYIDSINSSIPLVNCFSHSSFCSDLFFHLDSLLNIYTLYSNHVATVRETEFQSTFRLKSSLKKLEFPKELC